MSKDEIKKVLESYKEYQQMKKDVEKAMRELEGQILAIMEIENADTVTAGAFTARYTTCSRTSVNSKLLQSEYPDIYSKVAKVSEYKRFSVV